MGEPERPTEAQLQAWMTTYWAGQPRRALGRPRSLPRYARVLWLRYYADPPRTPEAIAAEYGLSPDRIAGIAQLGLSVLAHLGEDDRLGDGWDPESPLGRAVRRWQVQRRPFIPRWRGRISR
jgi:hypothetical protein